MHFYLYTKTLTPSHISGTPKEACSGWRKSPVWPTSRRCDIPALDQNCPGTTARQAPARVVSADILRQILAVFARTRSDRLLEMVCGLVVLFGSAVPPTRTFGLDSPVDGRGRSWFIKTFLWFC
jgi:hypothetical protein